MTSVARLLIGVLTTLLFLALGGMMASEERYVLAGVLVALGLIRGFVLARQVIVYRQEVA